MASLYIEQTNLLPLICNLDTRLPAAISSLSPVNNFESDAHTPELGLTGYLSETELIDEDFTDLVQYYIIRTSRSSYLSTIGEIPSTVSVFKRARCISDKEFIGLFQLGSVLKSNRARMQDKVDYWVRFTYADRDGTVIEDIGRAMFFISLPWRQQTDLLARIERYETSRSDGLWEVTNNIKSLIWTTIDLLHEPIGLIENGPSRYAIGKRNGFW